LEKAAEKKRRLKKKNFRNFLTGLPDFRRYSEKFGLGRVQKLHQEKTGQFLGGQGVAHSWGSDFF
jgi:hypothetical protein